ncbi:MAG: pilus assembly protein PilM [Oscillospiraceae bacterium]|nr:pilus assembly protein PilM [Oscillospiraceae bacterium]
MKSSLCILNNSIKLLFASPSKNALSVENWASSPLPEDAVLGGVIVNDSPVRTALSKLRGEFGNALNKVNLVLSSSSVLTKQFSAPKLPEKKLLKLIENEFADITEGRGELLYDYIPIPDGAYGPSTVLAVAVEKEYIGSYISLFQELGIKLGSIDISLSSLLQLSSCSRIGGKTCIMAVLDANSLCAALFVNGVFRFFNHNRLIEERGTEASAREIARHISSIIQFNTSEKTGREISHVYFGGLLREERGVKVASDDFVLGPLTDFIKSELEIEAHEFPSFEEIRLSSRSERRSFPLGEYVYCAGNLLGR